jgi:6-phosphogluconolactonase (cycloisomerase 2 family)
MTKILVGSYNTPDQPGVAIIDVDSNGTYHVVSQLSGIENPSFMTQHGTTHPVKSLIMNLIWE